MRRVLLLLAAAALLAGTVPAGAAKGVAFPDGEWSGTAVWTGAITKKDIFAGGTGDVAFQLGVSGGEVTKGELTMKGSGKSKVPGGSAELDVVASLNLSGTATVVKAFGISSWSGTATAQGFTVPVKLEVPAEATFSPSFASCTKVIGDLATETRKVQQSYGFNTSVTANFVAIRTGGGPDAESIVAEYQAITADLIEAQAAGFTANDLLALAHRIDALNAKILGLGPCQASPQGFEKGLQDTLLTALFQDLLEAPATLPGDFPTHYLISFLGVGIRVGAVGAVVPGSALLKEKASELLEGFEAGLSLKLDEAIAAGDVPTITDILIAAQQFGLDALADKAQGGLAEVGP